jgi:hypothetical protein
LASSVQAGFPTWELWDRLVTRRTKASHHGSAAGGYE